jgi:pimeloyl-ACP methyl ester carboxylesterase
VVLAARCRAGLFLMLSLGLVLPGISGCATLRHHNPNVDLRPCTDGFAITDDGWKLGVKHYRPAAPDPGKNPVVLAHGLGLNGTFWTITDDHLPSQLVERGYDVFVVDMRGSGASRRLDHRGKLNSAIRHTTLLELGNRRWNVDDEAFHDVPAILTYVQQQTGKAEVNWVGHSLGGMLMFPYLELTPPPQRIGTLIAMGAPAWLVSAPETKMLNANRNLRKLLGVVSTSRIARPMMVGRPPGLDKIDRLYYSAENVDRRTVDRFYGYTLEDPGPGALKQLDYYLEHGELVSADRRVSYARMLDRVRTPVLFVTGEGDVLAPMASNVKTFEDVGSPDKTFMRFGKGGGHHHDYGHCDLVWSRYAPVDIFPAMIDWLDRRQPGARGVHASGQTPAPPPPRWPTLPPSAAQEQAVEAHLRPRLELRAQPADLVQGEEGGARQAVLPRDDAR